MATNRILAIDDEQVAAEYIKAQQNISGKRRQISIIKGTTLSVTNHQA